MDEKREAPSSKGESLESFIPPLPRNHGQWSGNVGNSTWLFDLTYQRWDIYNGGFDTWGNIIQQSECPNADRVSFLQSYPDFAPYLIQVTSSSGNVDADYTFPAGLGLSPNRAWNFRQADGWVAQALGTVASDIVYLRWNRKLTWHELETCDRMILVPRVIHGYVPHGGGIEVLQRGPIGAEHAASPAMEKRMVDGRTALCGKGICQLTRSLLVRDSLRDVLFIFYCDDDSGEPTQTQLMRAQLLEQSWSQVEENAWNTLQDYVNREWAELYGNGCGGSAELAAIQIFPEDFATQMTDIGLLYENFVGDPEHGLGVRILGNQDDFMVAGPGDVAL